MQRLLENYTFNPTANTITINGESELFYEGIALIQNLTTGEIIFNADYPKGAISVASNVITVTNDLPDTMKSTDKLHIEYDKNILYDAVKGVVVNDANTATLANTIVGGKITATETNSSAIKTDADTLVTSNAAIKTDADTLVASNATLVTSNAAIKTNLDTLITSNAAIKTDLDKNTYDGSGNLNAIVNKKAQGTTVTALSAITATSTSAEINLTGFNSFRVEIEVTATSSGTWTPSITGSAVTAVTFGPMYQNVNGTQTLLSIPALSTVGKATYIFQGVANNFIKITETLSGGTGTVTVKVTPFNI